jgi:hypothetical protein
MKVTRSCSYCSRADRPIHLDHVVPRSRGGPDAPRNLVTACESCNMAKGDLLPSEWLSEVPPWIQEIEARVCASVERQIGRNVAERKRYREAKRNRSRSKHRCYFCGKPFEFAEDCTVQVVDQEVGPPFGEQPFIRINERGNQEFAGVLAYPGTALAGFRPVGRWKEGRRLVLLSHFECGKEQADGYWFPLTECWRTVDEDGNWFATGKSATEVQRAGCFQLHVAAKPWGGGFVDFNRLRSILSDLPKEPSCPTPSR